MFSSRVLHISFFCIFWILSLDASIQKHGISNNQVRLGLAGDTMLGRLVNELLKTKPAPYIWGTMLPYLQKNDLNFINLECAITSHEQAVPKVFNFKTDPKNITVLQTGNISGVNLANNHILDFGVQGLKDTLKHLKVAHIGYTGAGLTLQEAQKPWIVETNGLKLAFFGFTDNEPSWKATEKKPGTNYIPIRMDHVDEVITLIQKIRPNVDTIIISFQWGPNMREHPTEEFQQFARKLIDTGVDIFHGHSAHLVQGIEIYKNKLILYDTGDFVDDYMVHPKPMHNDLSFLFNVTIDKKGIQELKLIPCKIENMQVNVLPDKSEKKWLLEHIKTLSQQLGTTLLQDGSWKRS